MSPAFGTRLVWVNHSPHETDEAELDAVSELEAEEAQKLMAEYAKNRANSAASVANDNFGRALQ